MRRAYTPDQKLEALALCREVGISRAARRLGISYWTLHDWVRQTKVFAYSEHVGRGRSMSETERERLLAQLVHEQELEMRYIDQRSYRHDTGRRGTFLREHSLDEVLARVVPAVAGVPQRHLIPWLNPTFDEVAQRLAA